jgi:hypothetical protein
MLVMAGSRRSLAPRRRALLMIGALAALALAGS